jgi:hypothetical protein
VIAAGDDELLTALDGCQQCSRRYSIMLANPRVWIYLVVALVAAGLIAYSQWRDSDEQRLQRCIDASISQMKQDTPALDRFDNAQPALVEMSRASCIRQLGINPQTK